MSIYLVLCAFVSVLMPLFFCRCLSQSHCASTMIQFREFNKASAVKDQLLLLQGQQKPQQQQQLLFIYIPANQSASNTLAHSVSLRSSTVDVLICAINCQLKHKRRFSIYLIYLAPNISPTVSPVLRHVRSCCWNRNIGATAYWTCGLDHSDLGGQHWSDEERQASVWI